VSIIVTGASGQFGRGAVQALLERVPASELILTTRRSEGLAERAAQGAQVRYADFDDAQTLATAFAGGDSMLLISTARVGGRVEQHRRAIEAAAAGGVRHIVYTSSAGLDPKSPAIVIADHLETEALVKASGMAWTILRDSQYAEAIAGAIAPRALAAGRWIACAGEGRIAFVSREDCVACAAVVLTTQGHEGKTYELIGPQLMTYRQAAALVAQVGGRPIDYVEVDDEGMMAFWDSAGVPRRAVDDLVVDGVPWSSDDMVSYERAIREGYFDILTDHVRTLTGQPPRSLRDVLIAHKDPLRPA